MTPTQLSLPDANERKEGIILEEVSSKCISCNDPLNGVLYYCANWNQKEDCESFPLCALCLCDDCGMCPACCKCQEGLLFCVSCSTVEKHHLVKGSPHLFECSICTGIYDPQTVTTAEATSEGVDSL